MIHLESGARTKKKEFNTAFYFRFYQHPSLKGALQACQMRKESEILGGTASWERIIQWHSRWLLCKWNFEFIYAHIFCSIMVIAIKISTSKLFPICHEKTVLKIDHRKIVKYRTSSTDFLTTGLYLNSCVHPQKLEHF